MRQLRALLLCLLLQSHPCTSFTSPTRLKPFRASPSSLPLSSTVPAPTPLESSSRERSSSRQAPKQDVPFVGAGALALVVAGLQMAVSVLSPLASFAMDQDYTMPGMGGCLQDSNPSTTTVTCNRVGLNSEGRLFPCRAAENCLSTSSAKTPSKYAPPWLYSTKTVDPDKAYKALVAAVEAIPGASVVEQDGTYLRAEFPAKVPASSFDVVEFLMRPADNMVLFRSATRDSVFVYPLQQPLSDQASNESRLTAIRRSLGWGTAE